MRSKGEGSNYQRSDGRWVAAVTLGGKRLVRYATSRTEAAAKLRELNAQKQQHHLSFVVNPENETRGKVNFSEVQ